MKNNKINIMMLFCALTGSVSASESFFGRSSLSTSRGTRLPSPARSRFLLPEVVLSRGTTAETINAASNAAGTTSATNANTIISNAATIDTSTGSEGAAGSTGGSGAYTGIMNTGIGAGTTSPLGVSSGNPIYTTAPVTDLTGSQTTGAITQGGTTNTLVNTATTMTGLADMTAAPARSTELVNAGPGGSVYVAEAAGAPSAIASTGNANIATNIRRTNDSTSRSFTDLRNRSGQTDTTAANTALTNSSTIRTGTGGAASGTVSNTHVSGAKVTGDALMGGDITETATVNLTNTLNSANIGGSVAAPTGFYQTTLIP